MHLLALGVNHTTAPVALRERVAFPLEHIKAALQGLKSTWRVRQDENPGAEWRTSADERVRRLESTAPELAILSTCNRTEIYCASNDPTAREQTLDWLSRHHGVPADELLPHIYALPQAEAARHAFRVAAGLDSMVLGETQILGQFKNAVRVAAEAGALGTYLNQLFQRTFSVAKEVRGQTQIGTQSVSMAAAAVRLAQRIFESIGEQRVLFIGAGEMIELCTTHFAAQRPRQLVVANRSLERGARLAARFGGAAMPLADVPARLAEFDIVVACTASTLPIIGLGAVERAVRARRHRPVFIVDLAVPRDVEIEVGELQDVFLYTVDDLSSIVQEGNAARQAAVSSAKAIIESGVQNFMQWLDARGVVPVIRHLHVQADALRRTEVERARRMLARGDDPASVLDALSLALTNKFTHGPTRALTHANSADREQLIRLLRGFYRHSGATDR